MTQDVIEEIRMSSKVAQEEALEQQRLMITCILGQVGLGVLDTCHKSLVESPPFPEALCVKQVLCESDDAHQKSLIKIPPAPEEHFVTPALCESDDAKNPPVPEEHFVTQGGCEPDGNPGDMVDKPDDSGFQKFRRFVNGSSFDMFMGAIICLNVVVMCVELEKKGREAAIKLQLKKDMGVWSNSDIVFDCIGHFFNAVFFVELVLRLTAKGLHAFHSVSFVFDFLIVLSSGADYLVTLIFADGGVDLNFLRVARLVKLVKIFKTFKAASVFSELQILIKTLVGSLPTLVWSCVLLFFIMMSAAIFMAQMVASVIDDESADLDLRKWAFERYGSWSRCFYTLFESTLSGGWPGHARRLILEVSSVYVLFWFVYVMIVVFAVIRVIAALFLQQTIKIAKGDEQTQLAKEKEAKDACIAKITSFLEAADVDSGGDMDEAELQSMLNSPDVQSFLPIMGLDSKDVTGLFEMLDDGHGVVPHKVLVQDMMRLSSPARTMDTVILIHGQHQLNHRLDHILSLIVDSTSAGKITA